MAERGWGGYRTVTAAIRAAEEGAVVHVQPGVYHETLVIDTDVTVVADGGPGSVRIVSGHGHAVSVTGGAPVLRGITLQGPDRGSAVLVTAGAPVFEKCAVSGGRVDIIHAAAVTLRTCILEGAGDSSLYVTGTATAVVEDCVIRSASGHGLTLSDAARADVRRTTIEQVAGCGAVLVGESHGVFEDCTVRHAGDAAVFVHTTTHPVLRGCCCTTRRRKECGSPMRLVRPPSQWLRRARRRPTEQSGQSIASGWRSARSSKPDGRAC
ncbi:pectinesterase family protein [Streptomyces kaempferi]